MSIRRVSNPECILLLPRQLARRHWDCPRRRAVVRTIHTTLRLMYRLTADGVHHLPPAGGCVLVSNHPSYIDPPSIYLAALARRRVHFMAWDQLFAVPGVRWLCESFDAFPVDTEKADTDAYRRASRLLRGGEVVGVFPEGGRTSAPRFELNKRGAIRLAVRHQVPIVPCAVIGTREAWPVDRALPRPRGRVHVALMPPVAPPPRGGGAGAREASEQSVMDHLSDKINAALQRPVPSAAPTRRR